MFASKSKQVWGTEYTTEFDWLCALENANAVGKIIWTTRRRRSSSRNSNKLKIHLKNLIPSILRIDFVVLRFDSIFTHFVYECVCVSGKSGFTSLYSFSCWNTPAYPSMIHFYRWYPDSSSIYFCEHDFFLTYTTLWCASQEMFYYFCSYSIWIIVTSEVLLLFAPALPTLNI